MSDIFGTNPSISNPTQVQLPWDQNSRLSNTSYLEDNPDTLSDEGLFLIEDPSAHGPEPGTNAVVVQPYEIEEPEDDPSEITSTTGATGKGQPDLVGSLEDLHCDSDSTNPRLVQRPRRGRKRKPNTTVAGPSAAYQREHIGTLDAQYEEGSLSPKRRRRGSSLSPPELSEAGSSDSFTPESPFTDGSTTSASDVFNAPELMDLD
ncbi:hypothetical protein P170DRAFT_472644 [Aspergillus steynii IBT 23096]|uniref:Uncharacterized protein n=1 Tax=Aspergillus steynii IBT 23096 TaxID=1392250 RepID=A0A2I2GIP2_9EURO|nr:uncharacterized protein P170DRAFT_472644 [Aspergillus steynii IBT 23096]PLB52751.1 hypothetical protein P170DRAFT_472644 [Aspergillus steynii IBT 23096]